MRNLSTMKKKQLGQGMTEYIVIVALIAVAAIGAYGFFGEAVQNQVAALAKEVGGQSSQAEVTAAGTAATAAGTLAAQDAGTNNLNTYTNSGSQAVGGQ